MILYFIIIIVVPRALCRSQTPATAAMVINFNYARRSSTAALITIIIILRLYTIIIVTVFVARSQIIRVYMYIICAGSACTEYYYNNNNNNIFVALRDAPAERRFVNPNYTSRRVCVCVWKGRLMMTEEGARTDGQGEGRHLLSPSPLAGSTAAGRCSLCCCCCCCCYYYYYYYYYSGGFARYANTMRRPHPPPPSPS